MSKKRLDVLVVERGLCENRTKAQALIFEGCVAVDGTVETKAGAQIKETSEVTLHDTGKKYVGRGGLKLEHALDDFHIDPAGFVIADAGASTGGFTDCVLQRGAAKVYAIDVGYGQLDYRLRQDLRVITWSGSTSGNCRLCRSLWTWWSWMCRSYLFVYFYWW